MPILAEISATTSDRPYSLLFLAASSGGKFWQQVLAASSGGNQALERILPILTEI